MPLPSAARPTNIHGALLEKQKRKMEKKAAKKAAEEAKVAAESAANFAALQSKLGQGNWGDDEVNSCVRVFKND